MRTARSPLSSQLLAFVFDHDLDAHLLELALDDGDAVLVHRREDARQRLDDGDLGAELRVDHAELEADVAAADHDHALRDVVERERAGRVDDALLIDLEAGDLDRPRAGREHDVLGDDRLRAASCR